MKFVTFVVASLILLAVPSFSFAINADGCFQMYLPSVMYPVICVSGSNEEGIGGRGARVALVGPNSLLVRSCSLTSSIRFEGDVTKNKVTYFFDNGESIRFDGAINPTTNREEGKVTIGRTTLNYMRLLPSDTQRVLDAVYKSGKCNQ